MSINGVDMTGARHDQAVALLTSTSPTITLLVEREPAQPDPRTSPSLHRARPRSPPPPDETAEEAGAARNPCSRRMEDEYPIEEVCLVKAGGPLGLSIVGGSDHSSHPFGIREPGVFISKVIPCGVAARSGLRVGDRILEAAGADLRHATHQEAVRALLSPCPELRLLVRRDPPPLGMQEICIVKAPAEKLGISIRGGAKGHPGNPLDPTDEGVFISKVSSSGAAARDARLGVGMRILEVNQQSLLGMTHTEAVQALRGVGDTLLILVCDGFDPGSAGSVEASPGVIANPFVTGRKNSLESVSSIDRDLSPEEAERLQKEVALEKDDVEEAAYSATTEPLRLDYKTLAAVPNSGLHKGNRTPSGDFSPGAKREPPCPPPQEPESPRSSERPCVSPEDEDSPEQRSFRERQKYFEMDVRQQQAEGPPKRISLVGEDDLRKMREEEARRIHMKREQLLQEEDEGPQEDPSPGIGGPGTPGSMLIGVGGGSLSSLPGFSPSESQRNSLEGGEQRPTCVSGLGLVFPGPSEGVAPVRTAKAERRLQERLRVQSPELTEQEMQLSPAERRALQAEKRAMWRAASTLEDSIRQYEQSLAKKLYRERQRRPGAAEDGSRMKSLEQDALKAQVVIARSKEGRKRSTLDQLAESPSPAPTPSPTPLEDYSPRLLTSPGRLSLSDKKFDYREFAAIPSSKPVYDLQSPDAAVGVRSADGGRLSAPYSSEEAEQQQEEVELEEEEEHGDPSPVPAPNSSALEEMATYSNKRKLRHTRRSLETAVPT